MNPSSQVAPQQVTVILEALRAGEPLASDQLFTLVYADLRALAAAHLARMRPGP